MAPQMSPKVRIVFFMNASWGGESESKARYGCLKGLVVLLSYDFVGRSEKSFVWVRRSGEQSEFFAKLDGLRAPLGA
jgi:hypothetical protein